MRRIITIASVLNCCWLTAPTVRSAEGAGSAPAPAQITQPVKEGDLTTVKLTPQAEQRLGITLATVERKPVRVTRLFSGEVILPLGSAGATSAGGYFPLPRSTPDEWLRLADQQATSDGDIERARVQIAAAEIVLRRSEQMLKEQAGSIRAVDDAKAQLSLAQQALQTAQARRTMLGPPVGEAWQKGKLWVRVPVYSGEWDRLDAGTPASVGGLDGRARARSVGATPVGGSAPPVANAALATVDLFYEVDGDGVRPGQRVGVTIPEKTEAASLVVPWDAVLHDIYGGQWIYEQIAPQTFVRRRVQVNRVAEGNAVLATGPPAGTKVVSAGAAELFGTEFGAGK